MMAGETVLSRKALGMEVSDHVSDFRVMSSGAGYYIGTVFTYCGECATCKEEDWMPKGMEVANSRETGYFENQALAEDALEKYKKTDTLPNQRY